MAIAEFPAKRSAEWLSGGRPKAPNNFIPNLDLSPTILKEFTKNSELKEHVKAANKLIREALWYQVIAAIQDIEVVTTKWCPGNRIVTNMSWEENNQPMESKDQLWFPIAKGSLVIDRCSVPISYDMTLEKDNHGDGFNIVTEPRGWKEKIFSAIFRYL